MTTATKTRDGFRDLPLDQIDANPDQPRKNFNEDALIELAESIRRHGVLQPIVVRPLGGRYQIIAGERRWRATKRTGLEKIPARVMTCDDETTMILGITENVARRDMDPMEEANAYGSLRTLGRTIPEIAGLFGKTEKAVETSLDLLVLTEPLQWQVAKGHISKNIGVHLSGLSQAGQHATMVRISDGEFRDNDALIRHVSVMGMVEQQGPGFFDQDEDPITEARRSARKSEIERAWEKIEGMAAGFEPFLEMAPEDFAFAVGANVALYAAKLDVLTKAVNRMRNNVRQAAAIADVVLPEEMA